MEYKNKKVQNFNEKNSSFNHHFAVIDRTRLTQNILKNVIPVDRKNTIELNVLDKELYDRKQHNSGFPPYPFYKIIHLMPSIDEDAIITDEYKPVEENVNENNDVNVKDDNNIKSDTVSELIQSNESIESFTFSQNQLTSQSQSWKEYLCCFSQNNSKTNLLEHQSYQELIISESKLKLLEDFECQVNHSNNCNRSQQTVAINNHLTKMNTENTQTEKIIEVKDFQCQPQFKTEKKCNKTNQVELNELKKKIHKDFQCQIVLNNTSLKSNHECNNDSKEKPILKDNWKYQINNKKTNLIQNKNLKLLKNKRVSENDKNVSKNLIQNLSNLSDEIKTDEKLNIDYNKTASESKFSHFKSPNLVKLIFSAKDKTHTVSSTNLIKSQKTKTKLFKNTIMTQENDIKDINENSESSKTSMSLMNVSLFDTSHINSNLTVSKKIKEKSTDLTNNPITIVLPIEKNLHLKNTSTKDKMNSVLINKKNKHVKKFLPFKKSEMYSTLKKIEPGNNDHSVNDLNVIKSNESSSFIDEISINSFSTILKKYKHKKKCYL